jgi:enoyl-CoA hydratase/carnithine racemase
MATGAAWRREVDGSGTWTLWFDRPGSSQNSLDLATLDALDEQLRDATAGRPPTGLVLRSAKPGGFCAGADLRQIRACGDPAAAEAFARRGMDIFGRLADLPLPTVAVVHGACLGGGLELALACNRIVVLAGAAELKIGTPEVRLGLIPGWGGIAALPRRIGLRPALAVMLGGEPLGAGQAERLRLVEGPVAEPELAESLGGVLATSPPTIPSWPPADWAETLAEARRHLERSPGDHPRAKGMLLDVLEVELSRGPAAGREAAITGLAELAQSPEARAAIDAFFQRQAARHG